MTEAAKVKLIEEATNHILHSMESCIEDYAKKYFLAGHYSDASFYTRDFINWFKYELEHDSL